MTNFRKKVLISLFIIVPVGFGTKLYQGPYDWWLNDYVGGVFYEIFWCLVIAFLLTRTSSLIIAAGVFLITSLLEFLQLTHPPLLEAIRSHFIGRTLIGHSFTWTDFPYYVIGCLIGYLWMQLLKKWTITG